MWRSAIDGMFFIAAEMVRRAIRVLVMWCDPSVKQCIHYVWRVPELDSSTPAYADCLQSVTTANVSDVIIYSAKPL